MKSLTHTKKKGGVAQVVTHLLSNCEELSSNPSPTKKKITIKNNKKRENIKEKHSLL
jgi:hypothetical protein